MAQIFSVSVKDKNLLRWMEERDNADELPSLSKVFADALLALKDEWEKGDCIDIKRLKATIEWWQKRSKEQMNFIINKGLEDEFNNYQQELDKKIKFGEEIKI